MFGAAAAGCVFVPINPVLKAEQAAYILRDCNVRLLVTTAERWAALAPWMAECPDLVHVALMSGTARPTDAGTDAASGIEGVTTHGFDGLCEAGPGALHRCIDTDMAAILYTSGSTGRPKGVVLSHRNMVAGAASVAQYLANSAEDRVLAVLPLSFDYGLSQLTTQFSVGGCVVLHNYLLPGDVLKAMVRERISGLAAVPPLWIQLAALEWPAAIGESLRYFTNSGGAMPTATLSELRRRAPKAQPFLMYGLTEAFRSTYLPPDQVDVRPTSMGKAIPNAEILVVREDGSECAPGEPGELVHRGALVSMGYWNDPEATATAIRDGWLHTGDIGEIDADGYLKITDRKKDFIKTSGGDMIAPARIEGMLALQPEIGQAMVHGDRRPYLVALIVPREDLSRATPDPATLRAAIDAAVERVNRQLPLIERVRKFAVLDEGFGVANGLMTPTMKIKRHAIRATHGGTLDSLYG